MIVELDEHQQLIVETVEAKTRQASCRDDFRSLDVYFQAHKKKLPLVIVKPLYEAMKAKYMQL